MANDNEREARLARSLKRLDHRLVRRPGGGFAIADANGAVVEDETVSARRLSLYDVEAWIKEYIKPKAGSS
ncbi:MAG TPA: hypothetical protein VLW88_02630 [Hyphomicrobium sp.]|nr:hypothetical protein [Hyphomicrobium sp.]